MRIRRIREEAETPVTAGGKHLGDPFETKSVYFSFGSEYVSAQTCVEQLINLRTTLRYLRVPVQGPSIMFGDNQTVVNATFM